MNSFSMSMEPNSPLAQYIAELVARARSAEEQAAELEVKLADTQQYYEALIDEIETELEARVAELEAENRSMRNCITYPLTVTSIKKEE